MARYHSVLRLFLLIALALIAISHAEEGEAAAASSSTTGEAAADAASEAAQKVADAVEEAVDTAAEEAAAAASLDITRSSSYLKGVEAALATVGPLSPFEEQQKQGGFSSDASAPHLPWEMPGYLMPQ